MNILILMHFADIVDMLIESTLSTLVAWKFRPKYFQLSSWWSCVPAAARPPRPSGSRAATPWWRARGPSSGTATSSPTSTSASPSGAGSESWWVLIVITLFVLRRGAAHTPFGTEEIFHRSLVYSNWRFPGGWSSTEMSNWSNLMQI